MASQRRVFISYSSKDADLLNQVLEVFDSTGLDTAFVWHDRDTDIGGSFNDEIVHSIDVATIAVLLVSDAFLKSTYIRENELPRLYNRYEAGSLELYPITLEKCRFSPWHKTLSKNLQFACRRHPLKNQTDVERAACLREIAHDIRSRILKPTKVNDKTKNSLPTYGTMLFGRDHRLKQLDTAWKREHRNIVTIIAEGGVGKTALISNWLARMDAVDNSAAPPGCVPSRKQNTRYYNGAERVFCFSFYSQGSNAETRGPLSNIFLSEALRFFGDKNTSPGDEDASQTAIGERGDRLAQLVGEQNALVVLDGLEPLQYPSGKRKGELRDPELTSFLEGVMKTNEGLCVVTSRQELTDLTDTPSPRHLQINLENLSQEAGAELLEALGVSGVNAELKKAVKEYRGHALALNLLGTYLNSVHKGKVERRIEMQLDKRSEFRLLDPSVRLGAHAIKVMRSYQKWYDGNRCRAELNALSVMGLFDREATEEEIDALLAEPPIPGLTDSLMSLGPVGRKQAFGHLREARLLFNAQDDNRGIDAHPLVREYFGNELRRRNKLAWQAGHRRLYEHHAVQRPAAPPPRNLEEMRPWLLAVLHGCYAGLPKSVYVDVYCRLIAPDKGRRFLRDIIGEVSTNTEILELIRSSQSNGARETLSNQDTTEILNHLSVDARMLGDLKAAIRLAHEAVDFFGQMKMAESQVNALRHLSQYVVQSGNLKLARQFASDAVDKISDEVHVREQVSARCTLASILFHMGEIDKAHAEFQLAEDDQAASDESEADLLHRLNGFRFCEVLLYEGQYDEVIRRIRQTSETTHNKNLGRLAAGLADLLYGKALLRRGASSDLVEAKKKLASADRQLRLLGENTHRPSSLLGIAESEGDSEVAKDRIDAAFEIARKHGIKIAIADARLEKARWLARRHHRKTAEKELEILEREVAQMYYFRLSPEINSIRQLLPKPRQTR